MFVTTTHAYLPGFQVSRALGLMCFKWPEEQSEPVFHRFISTLILSFIILFSVISQVLSTFQLIQTEHVTMDILITRTQVAMCTVTVLVLALSSLIQAPITRRMLVTLSNVDTILQNSAVRELRNKLKYILITYISLWLVILLSFITNKGTNRGMLLPYMASVLIILISEQNVVALTIIIRNRFKLINKKLENLKKQTINNIWSFKNSQNVYCKKVSHVICLRKAHGDLCDVLRDLDATYRCPMVPILATHFFIVVGGLYFLYLIATGSIMIENVPLAKRFTTFAGITLFSAIRVVIITYACNSTVTEVQ